MDDAFYCRDEVAGVPEPAVGVVDDAAVFVLCDFVAVDEPFEWRSAVDDIPMRFFWYAGYADVFVDDEGCSRLLIGEPHCPFAKQEIFGFFFPK